MYGVIGFVRTFVTWSISMVDIVTGIAWVLADGITGLI